MANIFQKINEIDARYDPETDTISGCEPGSFLWWHEKGHQAQQEYSLCSVYGWTNIICLGLTVGTKNWIFAVIPLAFLTVLECHAWLYALTHYKK